MAAFEDFAATLGVPTAYASAAVAIFGLSALAERTARPEAIRDIVQYWKDEDLLKKAAPAVLVNRVFLATFGGRQLSWKCLTRSLMLTLASLLFLTVLDVSKFSMDWPSPGRTVVWISIACALDYMLLAKTRVLLRQVRGGGWAYSLSVAFLDFVSTVVLVFLVGGTADFVGLVVESATGHMSGLFEEEAIGDIVTDVMTAAWANTTSAQFLHEIATPFRYSDSERHWLGNIFILAPFAACFWLIVTSVATLLLDLAKPLRAVLVWFYPIEEAPVRGVGIAAGVVIVMFGIAIRLMTALFS